MIVIPTEIERSLRALALVDSRARQVLSDYLAERGQSLLLSPDVETQAEESSYGYGNGYDYGHGHGDGYGDGNGDGNGHGYDYGNGYDYGDDP